MSLLKRLLKKKENYKTVRIDGDDDIPAHLYWHGPSPVFLLPPEMLTWHGTQRYAVNHPLVLAASQGPGVLERFYSEFRPANLAQMYGVAEQGLLGEDLPPWRLPWHAWNEQKGPQPEVGLGLEHGVSYYGPCSAEKVEAEYRRVTSVVKRIRADGFKPDLHGHIEGYFMRQGNKHRFYVQGGKHRTAALVALGYERVPVRVRQTWPRQIAAGTEGDWPLVREGRVDVRLAEQILARFFRD